MSSEYFSLDDTAESRTTVRAAAVNDLTHATDAGFAMLPPPDALKGGSATYAPATGSAGAYLVAISPFPTAFANGMRVTMLANHDNPGDGNETLKPNDLAAKPIRDQNNAILAEGAIVTGSIYEFVYVTNRWQLMGGGPGGGGGDTIIYQVSADSEVIRPEDFALGSDGANLAAAFAQGVLAGTPVRLDGAYSISSALSTVTMTSGRLTVFGNGSITVTADIGVALDFHASYPTAVSVSSVTETTRSFPGTGTSACDCTRFTASGHGCEIGDLIKIVSDDQTAPQSVTDHRRGEFAFVGDVDGSDIYVAGRMMEAFTTTVRLVKVRRDVKLIWDGPTFAATPENPTWGITFLRVRGFVHPQVRTGCRDGYDLGLDISSCFMAEVDIHGVQQVNRASSGGSVGYLVQDNASAFSRVTVRGVDARHAYTNVTPTSTTNDQAYLYGRTYGSVVEGVGVGCSAAAFDTHTDGSDITFVGCSTGSTRYGESAAGSGVQLRGIRNRAVACADRGSVHGLMFYSQVSGDCVDCEAIDFRYVGTGHGIRIGNGSAQTAVRPRVRGGLIRTSYSSSVEAWDCQGAIIEDLVIAPTGSGSGTTGILLGGDAEVTVRNVTFDLTNYGGTNFRPFGFDAAADNNALVVRGARLINASGKFQAWFSGANNTSGTVDLQGLEADVIPTSGSVINAGSLDSVKLSDGWVLIDEYDHADDGDVAQVDFIDLGYDEVRVIARDITKASTGTLNLRVSTNNGSSFKSTSGDYIGVAADGVASSLTSVPLHTTNETAARSGAATISGMRNAEPKMILVHNTATANVVASGSIINGIRVFPLNGGNITGGTVQIFGR